MLTYILFIIYYYYIFHILILYLLTFLIFIVENIFTIPAIGGIQPSPRFCFSLTSNYKFDKMEIIIFGGFSKESDSKLYIITENGKIIII